MNKKKSKSQSIRYEVITQEDPDSGDIIVPLPPQVLESLGWKEGDQLKFEIGKDNQTIYVKKDNNEY